MIGIEQDVSISTFLISGVIAIVGWALRGGIKLLIAAIQLLVKKMVETISKVDLLDAKIADILKTMGDVEKTKRDLNEYYKRLKTLEDDFQNLKQ